jgi:hypothetical protein
MFPPGKVPQVVRGTKKRSRVAVGQERPRPFGERGLSHPEGARERGFTAIAVRGSSEVKNRVA